MIQDLLEIMTISTTLINCRQHKKIEYLIWIRTWPQFNKIVDTKLNQFFEIKCEMYTSHLGSKFVNNLHYYLIVLKAYREHTILIIKHSNALFWITKEAGWIHKN